MLTCYAEALATPPWELSSVLYHESIGCQCSALFGKNHLMATCFMKQASEGRLYMQKDHSMPFNVSTMSSFLMRLLNI